MDEHVNVVYDKQTCRVLVVEVNGQWMIPATCSLAHFENGVEPALIERGDGSIYFDPNVIVWRGMPEDA